MQSLRYDMRWHFAYFCGAFALRTAMDIGNGNIASVRLAGSFARIGIVVSEKIQKIQI